MSVTIAAIAGSLRAGSHTRALLRAAAHDLPPGIRLAIWDGLAHVPPYSEDLEAGPAPAGVAALRRARPSRRSKPNSPASGTLPATRAITSPTPTSTRFSPPATTSAPLTLTRAMLWEMEARKAAHPGTYIPDVVQAGNDRSWSRHGDGGEYLDRCSMQRLWLAPHRYQL